MNSKLQNRQIVRRILHSIQGPVVHNPQTPTQTNDLDQSHTHMHISSPLLRSLFLPANQFLQVCISIVSFFFSVLLSDFLSFSLYFSIFTRLLFLDTSFLFCSSYSALPFPSLSCPALSSPTQPWAPLFFLPPAVFVLPWWQNLQKVRTQLFQRVQYSHSLLLFATSIQPRYYLYPWTCSSTSWSSHYSCTSLTSILYTFIATHIMHKTPGRHSYS